MIRIISGIFRSRQLQSPNPDITRPTKDRVREAIFSSIQPSIKDSFVLDLFAGSGAMGFEALSRGARFCWFNDVEQEPNKVLKHNVALLKVEGQSSVSQFDAYQYLKTLKEQSKIDIIFLDPPYQMTGLDSLITAIEAMNLLSNHGIIVIESDKPLILDSQYYPKVKVYTYGKTVVTIGWK